MKLILAGAALALLGGAAEAAGSHAVRGYMRSNGTYVQPHRQSNPNSSRLDNYSTRGNFNPYSGQQGTRDLQPSGGYYGGSSLYLPAAPPAVRPPYNPATPATNWLNGYSR